MKSVETIKENMHFVAAGGVAQEEVVILGSPP